ncbi:NADH:flavin oxidoreductase/NADH oxidase family protein [Alteromonas oceanisediminis]|uniref:NADH:flavin oxidoreductase/NADH oxidase family protein n=1 Tax=Alteromonas oceanisediminis TaxID=2836180 RepID=UPI001BD9694B|nr:NADH:flavin oxidoreductase/NADH oxidase family protein [Alteromonas oceanisediminis]MBT0586594.1 NADH:flavin oxidoreductase/NADH oxidase family protein [Alteromonas oceanisediminis]
MSDVFRPITLPSGLTIKNRFVKAAMEENLANAQQQPDSALFNLYEAWAKGGVGLILTGNVMVDEYAMTGPGGVALIEQSELTPFRRLAETVHYNGGKIVMQINHPGRQVFKSMGGKVLSPSNVALNMGKHSGLFAQPTTMTDAQISDVIKRFTTTAQRAQQAGFDGVQIHAAHGYLLSQFLSPLTNKRDDKWGGSIENRARLLCDIVGEINRACGQGFSVSVKLNSADFQRGGFDIDDAQVVVSQLSELAVDFVELSGGSYEAPAMQGRSADDRTLAREAYFLTFAQAIAANTSLPIMTTGGISRLVTAKQVIDGGIDLVGMASALAYQPDLVAKWQRGEAPDCALPTVQWKDKALTGLATMALIKRQLRRLSQQKSPSKNDSPLWTLIIDRWRTARLTKRYRRNVIKHSQHSAS